MKDGRLDIDNNRSERFIKPFVIGRKNWLFVNTAKEAGTSATIYSIVETAKENRLKPFEYLKFLFEKMPNMDLADQNAFEQILPWSKTLPDNCGIWKSPPPGLARWGRFDAYVAVRLFI